MQYIYMYRSEVDRPVTKPLKLVLKVAQPSDSLSDNYSSPAHDEKKHKHKKKKKKKSSDKEKYKDKDESRKRKAESPILEEYDSQESPVVKKQQLEIDEPETKMEVDDSDTKSESRFSMTQENDGALLKVCLQYLQKTIQGKDTHGFFAFPVTDAIAPGYSSIIHHPMDFSAMQAKIENEEYRSVGEYKKDFVLMCNNAMTYNRPETIYYKEAKRLLFIGVKQLSKEKLLHMKKSMSFLANLSLEEMGLDEIDKSAEVVNMINEEEQRQKELQKKKEKQNKSLGRFEAVPDNLSPEEILAQAQAAAKEAKEELTLRQPKTDFAFLRKREDGSTTLNILNPDNDGKVSETEKVVNIGTLIGKLTSGTGTLAAYKEDKRNKVTPINYLNYGPFSSYAPTYDSSFSTLSKSESDLLLATYGDETGAQYATSVMDFVDTSGDYAVKMVNNLLDILTKCEHSKTQRILEAKRKEEEQQRIQDAKEKESINSVVAEHTAVDTSIVKEESEMDKIQQKLDHTASLITTLHDKQKERLSAKLPSHLAHIPGPTEKEAELAEKVTQELTALAKAAAPQEIVSMNSVRKAMGITLVPVSPSSTQPADDSNTEADVNNQSMNSDVSEIDNEFQEFLQSAS
ncbi:bromodomain-containing protein 7 isoform X2 [Patella vulgata]|uniref:bromodomain-containing protein 7 isoform X2 n=1 Tax=Patella vulgata TaxID=6465 RepID=UPI0024A846C8|nr:bromodomain-containing protein 7 isoform X2 [Patella vulgata]